MLTPLSFIEQAAALAAWRPLGLDISDEELRRVADRYDHQSLPELPFGQGRFLVPYLSSAEKTFMTLLRCLNRESPHVLPDLTVRTFEHLLSISHLVLRKGLTQPTVKLRLETIDLLRDRPTQRGPAQVESELLPHAGVIAAMAYDKRLLQAMLTGGAPRGFWLPAYELTQVRGHMVPYVGFPRGERVLAIHAAPPRTRPRVADMSIPRLVA